ncbi:MAG: pyridoxal-phosphate dependent enzyme [Silicimonas sp.]|nr:pyridoxal-phosphate dependent enzyme [Silicimonas sp.]
MADPSERLLRSAAQSVETRRRIAPLIRTTPVLPSRIDLPEGTRLIHKLEHHQHTGSFKFRGACAKLSTLLTDRPVITASSGNHGMACSRAAQRTGHRLSVVLPKVVLPQKRAGIESYGTRVIIEGADSSLSELAARARAEADGLTYVSPYNDAQVIAGQGTLGLEILEQCPEVDNIFISMGGGGLISGIGAVIKSFAPQVRIIGASATNSAALAASIKAGRIVETAHHDTLADGIAGGVDEGSITLPMATEVIDEIVHCDEDQIAQALRLLAWRDNMIVEGAAGLALAAFLAAPERYAGQTSMILLCGANYDQARMAQVLGAG